jgi:hypothetical protein
MSHALLKDRMIVMYGTPMGGGAYLGTMGICV